MRTGKRVNDLLNALESDDWAARWDAAMSLGELGDKSAVEPLVRSLTDDHYLVRLEAARALHKLGWMPECDAEKAHYLTAKREWSELERLGQVAVESLIRILRDENWEVQRAAKQSLVSIGEPAVESLIRALCDEDKNVRDYAADALGDVEDERAVGSLIGALRDDNSIVRRAAAISLGKIRDARAVAPLIQSLRDKERHVVEAACWALGQIGNAAVEPLVQALIEGRIPAAEALAMIGKPAVEPLIQLLQHKDVAHIAAATLGMMGDKQAIAPLTAALQDQNEKLRKAAEEALESITKGIRDFPLID